MHAQSQDKECKQAVYRSPPPRTFSKTGERAPAKVSLSTSSLVLNVWCNGRIGLKRSPGEPGKSSAMCDREYFPFLREVDVQSQRNQHAFDFDIAMKVLQYCSLDLECKSFDILYRVDVARDRDK